MDITTQDMITRLQQLVTEAGNYRRAAEWLHLDHAYVYRVIHGTKRPGKKLLAALGLQETSRVYAAVGSADMQLRAQALRQRPAESLTVEEWTLLIQMRRLEQAQEGTR
jgi:hypothetical protein